MKKRRTPSVHALGELTGAGDFRSLCNAGMVTGPYATLDVSLLHNKVNCQRCLRRMGEVTQGD